MDSKKVKSQKSGERSPRNKTDMDPKAKLERGNPSTERPNAEAFLKESMSVPIKSPKSSKADPVNPFDLAVVQSEPILDSYYRSPGGGKPPASKKMSNPNGMKDETENFKKDTEDSEEKEMRATKTSAENTHGDQNSDPANLASTRMRLVVEQMKQNPKVKLWAGIRREIQCEMEEVDKILAKLGFPSQKSIKYRCRPFNEYDSIPDPKTCFVKDYADHHLFVFVLPAIRSLIAFAQKNRILQCHNCTFNALDYIVEYMYNNNHLHPERALNPVPLPEIPFAKAWLKKYPRKEFPKWLTMDQNVAASIIQRNVRGFLIRKRPEIQEVRQFWIIYKKDQEADKKEQKKYEKSQASIYSPYYDFEIAGEQEHEGEGYSSSTIVGMDSYTRFITHSDTCFVCTRFREFIRRQKLDRESTSSIMSVSSSQEGEENANEKIESNRDTYSPQSQATNTDSSSDLSDTMTSAISLVQFK